MFHSYPGANVQRIPVTLSEASDSGWLRASLNAQLSCHPNASLQRSRLLNLLPVTSPALSGVLRGRRQRRPNRDVYIRVEPSGHFMTGHWVNQTCDTDPILQSHSEASEARHLAFAGRISANSRTEGHWEDQTERQAAWQEDTRKTKDLLQHASLWAKRPNSVVRRVKKRVQDQLDAPLPPVNYLWNRRWQDHVFRLLKFEHNSARHPRICHLSWL